MFSCTARLNLQKSHVARSKMSLKAKNKNKQKRNVCVILREQGNSEKQMHRLYLNGNRE